MENSQYVLEHNYHHLDRNKTKDDNFYIYCIPYNIQYLDIYDIFQITYEEALYSRRNRAFSHTVKSI